MSTNFSMNMNTTLSCRNSYIVVRGEASGVQFNLKVLSNYTVYISMDITFQTRLVSAHACYPSARSLLKDLTWLASQLLSFDLNVSSYIWSHGLSNKYRAL